MEYAEAPCGGLEAPLRGCDRGEFSIPTRAEDSECQQWQGRGESQWRAGRIA